jgi:hypothetical protein
MIQTLPTVPHFRTMWRFPHSGGLTSSCAHAWLRRPRRFLRSMCAEAPSITWFNEVAHGSMRRRRPWTEMGTTAFARAAAAGARPPSSGTMSVTVLALPNIYRRIL